MFKRDFKMKKIILLLPLTLFANECIKCHQDKLKKCKNSNHYTLKNAINTIFKTFGFDTNYTLQTLPNPKNAKNLKNLVTDMLRRKCMRCHLNSKQINTTNNLCLSCHNSHQNALDAKKAKPTQNKCLKCHNGEFIGTDYLGLFPKDYDKAYRAPIINDGTFKKPFLGSYYHNLSSDIHHQKSLSCISCHSGAKWEKIECKKCHNSLSEKNHKSYHKNISCNACHSAWMVSSYELHLLIDDTKNYKQWKRLTKQFDPYLENFLLNALKNPNINPVMPDYLTNELKEGIWYMGWKFKRWENFILVKKSNGKIYLAKPQFQYFLTYKDKNGLLIFNNISEYNGTKFEAFLPKAPHTITKKAKNCEMCHENKIIFNKAINNNLLKGKTLKAKILNKGELKKMQSNKYKKIRAKMLFN
jgi:hypothetical protein